MRILPLPLFTLTALPAIAAPHPARGTPGYVIFNQRAGWHVNENLTLVAAVENLTDEDYRIHGSGQNEPGINAIVTANLKF